MLTILGRPRRACHGLSRRELLQVGGAGLFGLSLPKVMTAENGPLVAEARAKSVLFIFLYGGPSQLETFDMKPDAPSTIRGPFHPIASRTPGLRICQHLPKLAARSDQYCVVRTLNHPKNDHNATHYIQTGHPLPPTDRGSDNNAATRIDWPAMGSVVEYLDQRAPVRPSPSFPTYVYLPKRLGHFAGYDINGQYAGWLGPEYDGLATDISNKRSPDDNPYFRDCPDEELDFRLAGLKPIPEITIDRLNGRAGLLEQFNVQRREIDNSPQVSDFDVRRQQALSFLTSKKIGAAFDIRHESDRLRDRYGRNLFGQSLLMGRRMIEAGARFVTVGWDLPVRSNDCHSWDMHACLERVMRDHLLPGLDWGLSALLEDLEQRGLLDETLVVAVGEMGRTPAFKNRGQEDGRDHWSYCFPSVLAGAGIHGGMTYGRSDKDAAYPLDNPVSPEDLACTIFDRLGIDPRSTIPDAQGRPVPLVSDGRVLHELFS